MLFNFEVAEIGRDDKTTGKVVLHGRTKGGRLMIASLTVPMNELQNYKIDDKFVLLPAAAQVTPTRTTEEISERADGIGS